MGKLASLLPSPRKQGILSSRPSSWEEVGEPEYWEEVEEKGKTRLRPGHRLLSIQPGLNRTPLEACQQPVLISIVHKLFPKSGISQVSCYLISLGKKPFLFFGE